MGGWKRCVRRFMRMRRATAADPAVPGTRVELDMDQRPEEFVLENLSRMGK